MCDTKNKRHLFAFNVCLIYGRVWLHFIFMKVESRRWRCANEWMFPLFSPWIVFTFVDPYLLKLFVRKGLNAANESTRHFKVINMKNERFSLSCGIIKRRVGFLVCFTLIQSIKIETHPQCGCARTKCVILMRFKWMCDNNMHSTLFFSSSSLCSVWE